jgi:hypothetical protein
MILLAAERRMTAAEIAEIVRASEETVRRSGSSATSPKGSRVCAIRRAQAHRAR